MEKPTNEQEIKTEPTFTQIQESRRTARRIFKENGLDDYSFRFSDSVQNHGQCIHGKKLITVSMNLLMYEGEFMFTLLHEVAHALTPHDGHGYKWAAECVRLGIEPRRTRDIPGGYRDKHIKYIVTCQSCGTINKYLRKPKCADKIARYHCGKCNSKELVVEKK